MGYFRNFTLLLIAFDAALWASERGKIKTQRFRQIKGFGIIANHPGKYKSTGASRVGCGKDCLENSRCSVFAYGSRNRCRLTNDRDDSVQLQRQEGDSLFYAVYQGDTWFLMFSAQSETGIDIYGALMGTANLSRWLDCEGTSCDVFRSPLIDVWDTLPIGEVKFVFYGSGKKVLELRFEGRNSTKENWFSVSRLLQSPWADLDVNRSVNFFSVRGHPGVARYFYINYFHDGCPYDRGWMALINTEGECGWEVFTKYPVFLYSTAAGSQVWNSGDTTKMIGNCTVRSLQRPVNDVHSEESRIIGILKTNKSRFFYKYTIAKDFKKWMPIAYLKVGRYAYTGTFNKADHITISVEII